MLAISRGQDLGHRVLGQEPLLGELALGDVRQCAKHAAGLARLVAQHARIAAPSATATETTAKPYRNRTAVTRLAEILISPRWRLQTSAWRARVAPETTHRPMLRLREEGAKDSIQVVPGAGHPWRRPSDDQRVS
jgi:hypothetical protein